MTPAEETLWPLDYHTKGKHRVLRHYLDAWFPIMGKSNNRILFIDGFAGPGEYEGGEKGSPQIALQAFCSAKVPTEMIFIFIEEDRNRTKHLRKVLEPWEKTLPSNAKFKVSAGKFDEQMSHVLDKIEEQKAMLAPAFVMIDPFGVSGTPMSVVQRILANPKCEVYFSFMYEPINRFKNTPQFKPHLDKMFGVQDWQSFIDVQDSKNRRNGLYDLYIQQLRAAGAEHVLHFDIYNYNSHRLKYSVFFATQHPLGCDKMKQAMWKTGEVAPNGNFEFRENELQGTLSFQSLERLKKELRQHFGDGQWHSIEKIESFMQSDKTNFHSGQLKTGALRPMERDGLIEVDKSTRRRPMTYPAGCQVRFRGIG